MRKEEVRHVELGRAPIGSLRDGLGSLDPVPVPVQLELVHVREPAIPSEIDLAPRGPTGSIVEDLDPFGLERPSLAVCPFAGVPARGDLARCRHYSLPRNRVILKESQR